MMVINGIKDALEILQVITPSHEQLSSNFWSASAVEFQRFGMPSQTATTARNMGRRSRKLWDRSNQLRKRLHHLWTQHM